MVPLLAEIKSTSQMADEIGERSNPMHANGQGRLSDDPGNEEEGQGIDEVIEHAHERSDSSSSGWDDIQAGKTQLAQGRAGLAAGGAAVLKGGGTLLKEKKDTAKQQLRVKGNAARQRIFKVASGTAQQREDCAS